MKRWLTIAACSKLALAQAAVLFALATLLVFATPARATCPPSFVPSTVAPDADCIFRDYQTDGVPSSGAHNPSKSDIRHWGEVIGSSLPYTIGNTLPIINAKAFNASGSATQTTASTTASSNSITVASGIDLQQGQGVRILGAGPAFTAGPVSAISSTIVGSSGSNTIVYNISSIDYAGGIGAAVSYTVFNTPASVIANGTTYFNNTGNYVRLSLSQGSGSSGYVIYRGVNGATPSLYSVGTGNTWEDRGIGWVSGGSWLGPDYFPTSAPSNPSNDWLVATISTISGTTLTLSAAATSTVTGAALYHDDTAALNAAAASVSSTGGNITLPCGYYNISSSVTSTNNYVGFTGSGMCSEIIGYGTGYNFYFPNTNISAQQRGNFVQNVYIVDRNKSTGYDIYGSNLFNFGFANLQIDLSPNGIFFLNSNTINVSNVDINSGTRAWASSAFRMASDGTNYTCCLNAINFYAHGNAIYTGTANSIGGQDKNGFVFDGNVATVYSSGIADSNIEGTGFVINNDTGNAASPTYLTFYSASCEFPTSRCVNIFGPGSIAGPQDIYFTDSTLTGAQNNNTNFVTDSTSSRISFRGGKNANAGCRGFDIYGTQTTIIGAMIGNNSTSAAGGTSGACDGVVLEASSRGSVVTGNAVGDPFNPTIQRYPVTIVNGADYFSVSGNTFYGNVTNCVNNGGSTAVSRIVANNAGSC